MATVYVFGAGGSYHAGYPLASALGGPLLKEMLQSSQAPYAEHLIDQFGVPADFEDWITTILSRRDEAKGHTNRKHEYQKLGTALGMLTLALAEWFRRIGNGSAAPLYAQFSDGIVRAGDVVITFNYDDALDRELRRTGKWDVFSHGYGFPFGNGEHKCDVPLLKLHGSMNWVWNPFSGAQGGGPLFSWSGPSLGTVPVMLPRDLKFLGYDDPSGPGVYQSGGALHSMILPGRSKQFYVETSSGVEQSNFWELLWSQAEKALGSCSKMVICGYSLPTADQQARDLLFNGPPKDATIEVVCGQDSQRIATEFKSLQFSNVATFGRGYFEDWLAATETRSPGLVLRLLNELIQVLGTVVRGFLKLVSSHLSRREGK
jgi:hypothetical protein